MPRNCKQSSYTRAPDASNTAQRAPANDPIFDITETPKRGPGPTQRTWTHRAQPLGFISALVTPSTALPQSVGKSGSMLMVREPNARPFGNRPQGDEVRIYSYVRCVRSADEIQADMQGDVNSYGIVGVSDLISVNNFIFELATPTDPQFATANINEDGLLNVSDLIAIMNMILGIAEHVSKM